MTVRGTAMNPDPVMLMKKLRAVTNPACDIAMKYFGKVTGTMKPDKSYLTSADMEIETLLRKKLPKIIEGSVVVGEEMDVSAPTGRRVAEWTWVIDPIDGTSVFLDGLPMFCVCVGLMKRGRPYAGMLRYPATGDIYEAVRGNGAFYNGVRIKIDAKTQLRHEAPIYVPPKIHYKYRITYRGKTRNFGSTATHVALVARGVALATVGRANVWDYAAAAAILIEAGGEIKYVDGGRIDWPSLIYSRDKMPLPVIAAERSRWNEVASMVEYLNETD